MAGDRGALQFDLFGGQTGSDVSAAVASPPMMTASGWQVPETMVFVDALKRGALSESIAAIRRLKVDTAWKVLLEAGFTVGTGKTHAELLGPLQKDLMEAAQRQMSGRELKVAREKVVKPDPETELRALWTEQGVPRERQDALIHQIAEKSKPGATVGPFEIRGQAVQSEQPIEISSAHEAVAERFGIPARSVAEIAQLSTETLIARDRASGQILPNAMTPAKFDSLPLGSVRLSSFGGDLDNRYVDYLREFDSQMLVTAETEQGIKQDPTYARYLEWAKGGMEIPPISVYEVGEGVLQSTNRRRTLVAQELGLTVKGWFGVANMETGLPLKYGDVRSAIQEVERQKVPDAPQKDAELRTGDAGAELTYNRRNRVKRGLVWADLEGLEAALRVREVTKAKVYPRPDYQGLIDSGVELVHAHLVKQVYDSLAAKPTANNPSDAQLQAYITGVNRVMAGALSWVRDPNGAKLWNGARASGSRMLDQVYPNSGWKELRDETSLLGRRYFSVLQPGYAEGRRAKLAVGDGWPSVQEAWQKQGFSVVSVEEVTPSFYAGKGRDGVPYVSVRLVDGAGKAILDDLRVDGVESENDPVVTMKVAARTAELVNRFALVNKRGRLVSVHESETAAVEAARESVRRGGEAGISDSGISVEVAQRIGAARRVDGENVSSEQVLATFGFRGINFGNWMKGKGNEAERQLHLNHIYDAFLDLAEILDLPPKAMSLDGMLGIAVGAQGGGQNLAHFVPGVNEINLTRTSGAGALAHEWAHALDHYFARMAGLDRSDTPFLSAHALLPPTLDRMVLEDGKWKRAKEDRFGEGLRPEMRTHFGAVVNAMTKRPITDEEVTAREVAALERTKGNVSSWLKAIRRDFESDRVRSTMMDVKGESVSVLDAFDGLSRRVLALDLGGDTVAVSRNKAVSPVVAEIRDLYKVATGRLYSLDNTMGLQSNVDLLRYQLSAEEGARSHVPQMVSTEFAKAAARLDKDKQTPYWSTALEMFARSFDVFVSEKLEERTAMNSYLSHTGRASETTPVGDERRVVVAAIGDLVGEVRTRETEKGVALFSFAGERAAEADLHELSTAKQRLLDGDDSDVVRRDTGWFKGADEKWRFEISDADAEIANGLAYKGTPVGPAASKLIQRLDRPLVLADVLDHPALYAAYPALAEYGVTFVPESVVEGNGLINDRQILVSEDLSGHEVLSTLLHEVQHGIQTIEGFAQGGSVDSARKHAYEKAELRRKDINGEIELLAKVRSQIPTANKDAYLENVKQHKTLVEERNSLDEVQEGLKYDLAPAARAYRQLAGEVEARNVQARLKLSQDERRAMSPEATADVNREDVIVVFNGREMAFAPLPANALGEVGVKRVRQPHSVASLEAAIDGAFSGTKDFARLLTATGRFEIIEAKDVPAGLIGARFSAASVAERDRSNIETAARRMGRFVDAFVAGQVKDSDTQIIGDTPTVLQGLGAHDLPLQIDGQTVKKILEGKHKHLMTADMLKGVAQYIYDPLMVFDSPGQNGGQGKLIITEISDRLGAPVVVAIHLDKQAGRLVINDIASAYGMDGSDKRLLAMTANLEYVRNEKDLGPSTTPNHTYLPGLGVVQKARSLGVNLLTETDIVKQFGVKYSVADERSPFVGKEVARTPMDKERKTLLVDGVERPAQNSNGQLIHWSEEGTRNFWRWFGEGRSVDGEGRPVVAFHGTISDFDVFNGPDSKEGSAVQALGNWFASKPKAAERFAVDPADGDKTGANIMTAYLSVKNPKIINGGWNGLAKEAWPSGYDSNSISAWKEDLLRNGYDGIELRGSKTDGGGLRTDYIAFAATQIKSAIGNRGDFDVDNPDIRYSKDGRILAYVVDGQIKLVADNISQVDDDVRGLLMHEIGVHALRLGRSDSEFRDILTDFEKLRDSGDTRVVAAFERVPVDTAPHLVSEEALGYFVEANPRLPLAARVTAWFKEQIVKIADRLPVVDQSRIGEWARSLSTDDLVYMACAATRDAVGGLRDEKVVTEDRTVGERATGERAPGSRCEGRGR